AQALSGYLEPEDVAQTLLKAMEENRFMVTTHEQTAGYAAMKGAERDRWVGGMRKLRRMLVEANNGRPL
ncbi:MAG TPA: short-chain dehydrogenase, partial [Oceanicaulis sp.]|nr:short-chain dehydrogenase [Oceanicaulis sp.]